MTETSSIGMLYGGGDMDELITALPSVIQYLKDAGMYNDWKKYVHLLGSHSFPLNNIAHLLFLDVWRWLGSQNPIEMLYSDAVKQFWFIGHKLFHGKFLRFMSGYGHSG